AADVAVLAFEIHDVGVARIDAADKAVAAGDGDPIFVDRAGAGQRLTRPAPRAVVLHAAVDAVRLLGIDGDMIELTDSDGIEVVPMIGAIIGGVEAAVAADNLMPAVARVDPPGVMIGMDAARRV